MTAFTLAWRTAARYKARALLAIAGVAIIGALNFDMLLLSRGLLVSFADMLNSVGFDVRVLGAGGLPMARVPVTGAAKLADEIRRLPEVDEVASARIAEAVVTMPGRSDLNVTLVGTSESMARGGWRILSGSSLTEDGGAWSADTSVIVARRVAERLNVEPGSTLRLQVRLPGVASALPPVICRVVGVAGFSFESADDYTVATTMSGFNELHGGAARDEADVVLVASNPHAGADVTAAAIARLRPDLRVYSNEQVVEQFNRNGFAYFRQISLVLSLTTIVFSFLLVATLLTVSVNQRLGEVASLRALGISQARIAALLLWESALLVGLGGALAVPLGGGLAIALDRILRQMPGLPERLHFFVFEPQALATHAVLLAVTAIVAALYPMWLAVNLPIAETLRREVVS